MVALTILGGWQARDFNFDASSDTLVVQDDPALANYERMTELFGGDDFIVLAWRPVDFKHFSRDGLNRLADLQEDVESLDGIADVMSMLDAPLIASQSIPVEELSSNYKTLRDQNVDLEQARQELTDSPLFRDFLISSDGSSSVIRITLSQEKPTDRNAYVDQRKNLIDRIRTIRDQHDEGVDIYISGVPMIAADMIEFVKADLKIFGSLVFGIVILLLAFFFRRVRWVLLPILISGISILLTTGILAWLGKPVTVISSNFMALLAILCISFSVHLIVRYRELLEDDESVTQQALVWETMSSKFAPCFYTALTTILAFGSLLASRILPVEDFGWMMCLGMVVAFVVTYILFPAVLVLLGKGTPASTLGRDVPLTRLMSSWSRHYPWVVISLGILASVAAGFGLRLVTYDNRFVDYFDEDTDIHQGMGYIDNHLGGTVPFDVYLQLGKYDDASDEADSFFTTTEEEWPERYWFTAGRIETIRHLHEFIENREATGKVVSVATLEEVAQGFNDGEPLTGVELAYVLNALPVSIREQLILPYAKPTSGFARINVRTVETREYFSRDQLVSSIREHATQQLGLEDKDVIVTGMMVLFNDMLKRLAESQQQTLIYVIGATLLMFGILLRSALLAVLALTPNLVAAASVTSVMGYSGIPLDMMTITIAAISIGIGVDDAVHYSHRFRQELQSGSNIEAAIKASHQSIGQAMYFTSAIIILGFSTLAFSNFLPTVYFGLLTALAMGLALLANLTLLPALLMICYKGRF